MKKTLKNAKIAKLHNNEMPQLLTPDGSNMTHNDRWILGNYDLGSVANGTVAPCPSYTDRIFLAERGRLHNNHFQNYQYFMTFLIIMQLSIL